VKVWTAIAAEIADGKGERVVHVERFDEPAL
jgi:hypothetical protein